MMNNYASFYDALKTHYVPSMYEVHGDKSVNPAFRAYPWTGGMLYYEIFKHVFPKLEVGSNVMDLGAYPGSFLRILDSFFKSGKLNLYGYGMVCETDEIRKYNERHLEHQETKCVTTQKSFTEFMSEQGISFVEGSLDYCSSDPEDSFRNISDKTGTMDVVTCMEVIEHLHNPYFLMDLSNRLLKKGGTLVLETNNVRWGLGLLQLIYNGSNLDLELVDKYKLNDPTIKHPHVRYYSLRELITLCRKAGFKINAAYDFNWNYPLNLISGKEKLKGAVKKAVSQIPGLRSHIIVVAEKK